jgi:hypothetical protein
MHTTRTCLHITKLVLTCGLAAMAVHAAAQRDAGRAAAPVRPEGPCDIYRSAGTPCVAAHSTTRALSARYDGPLYQVRRASDGRTRDIGIVAPSAAPVPDAGGYADAAAQDAFCANTPCVITVVYDQSGTGNDLRQAPPGPSFKGPAKGGFDTQPIADMAPITIGGHKAYGVYIMPGMGLRNNDAAGLAIGDEPEGIYYVIDGTHFDSGCCFDYGNASTNGRAVGTGTMETTYFGTATAWGRGAGPGPWVMADLEAGLFSGYDAKENVGDPTIDRWRFVTAVVDGGGGNRWDLRGGNAQEGGLTMFYSGVRPGSRTDDRYFPMHKQGAVLLGTGGDNGNGSSGTFYEGVMTTGYPAEATTDAVQANIVAAKYDVARVNVSRVTTFRPRASQDVTLTFTNTTGAPVSGVTLRLVLPAGWTAAVSGGSGSSTRVAPGAIVHATFRVTSPAGLGAGLLTARAEWTGRANRGESDAAVVRVRNAPPITINEVRFSAGADTTNQFVELYNAFDAAVDLSHWSLVSTPSQWGSTTLAAIPAGTTLAPHAHYLLGLSTSGLAASAAAGATTINVRSTTGFEVGQTIDVDGESRAIARVGTPASAPTTIFVPVSTGPWLTMPAGSTNVPVASAAGFEIGQAIGIDLGDRYEEATATAVGMPATQTVLAAAASAGATNVKLAATSNMLPGDRLTIGTGSRKEIVTIASVGTPGASGTGVTLTAPLTRDHASGVDASDPGTGISFSPATRFAHTSGDAVQALGSGVTLDRALTRAHAFGAPIVNARATSGGYQGPPAPRQWFGAALSPTAGSLALLDASGAVVVDAIVYGSQQSSSSGNGTIASPELATLEGDQRQGGCIVVVPAAGRGFGPAAASSAINRSVGRFPDGADADSNCTDFGTQAATTLAAAAAAGATNVKIASVADFAAGQTLTIDTGASAETTTIAAVGTAGATTIGAATIGGATTIQIASPAGFAPGQTITIDQGASAETATVASMTGGGRGRGPAAVTVAAPLAFAHADGAQISGTGLTLTSALTRAHAAGAPVANGAPTPGAPNRYERARR